MYVEDEIGLGSIVKETLVSRGYHVVMVTDGGLVQMALEDFRPDICVLDIMLPNKDGFTIAQEIRVRHPETPIIFLSAKNQTESVLKGFASGGNDYMRKPFSLEELIVRMENLLSIHREKMPENNSEKQFGNFVFDSISHELKNDNESWDLPYREGKLLEVLLQYENQVVNRSVILETIWGSDSHMNSRTLDVYINRLRKILKADENLQLKTIKGVGYLFVVR